MKFTQAILFVLLIALMVGCSATRYVPKDRYLLRKNVVEVKGESKKIKIPMAELESYIQQRPNRRFLGIGIPLAFYNATDSSKHNWWHKFWNEKIGQAPVVMDSSLIEKSRREMTIYLHSLGQLGATVTDTVILNQKKRKAEVRFLVRIGTPYTISSFKYEIMDDFLRPIVLADTAGCHLRVGVPFERKLFEAERTRITEHLRNRGFWGFNQSYISYTADTVSIPGQVAIVLQLRRLNVGVDAAGQPILENHPIYRIGNIVLNSAYDPVASIDHVAAYDTISYRGVEILYSKKLFIRKNILVQQLSMSPGELFDQSGIERTYNNIRSLGYNSTILFTPKVDSTNSIEVTTVDGTAHTSERTLNCVVQCTANVRQNFSAELEASTTSDYYSLALKLGYQNRNLFRGAEDFNVSFRGAYEFMKAVGKNNSYEFGVSTSIALPRFLLPVSDNGMRAFSFSSTQLSLAYNIQRRPDYQREIISAVFGYGWTLRNGARFTINPADINVVHVPWISQTFLDDIDNPYLRNSYSSQLIAGLSASYYYNTNSDIKKSGFTIRGALDVNGNLISGLTALFSDPVYRDGEQYYNLFGLRFAQYARASADVSQRLNVGSRSQIAWRFLLAGGVAYNNSKTLPFERLFFAGGSNSMRGWQVRTLGPGSTLIENLGTYPNQLGDMRLEVNFEYRINVIGGFNMALFFDAGNIWMNGKGETRKEANFRFSSFASQIALNTGIGARYDFGYFLIRLDWGIKLHNPNVPVSERWFKQMGLSDTALHFAIGLPF